MGRMKMNFNVTDVLFSFFAYFSGPNTSLYERARSKSNGKRKVSYLFRLRCYVVKNNIYTKSE